MKELANALEEVYRNVWAGNLDMASDVMFGLDWTDRADRVQLIIQRAALDIVRDARLGELSPNGLSIISELQKLAEALAAREG